MTWLPSSLTRRQREERRRAAARLLRQGKLSQAAIARHLGVSRISVWKWRKQLTQQGLRGLRAHPIPGRPARLNQAQWRELLRILRRGAIAQGFATHRWTLSRIQAVVQQRFGVIYSPPHLSRRLHALGWSLQRPVPQPLERDDVLVEAWLKRDWPTLKKRLSGARPSSFS